MNMEFIETLVALIVMLGVVFTIQSNLRRDSSRLDEKVSGLSERVARIEGSFFRATPSEGPPLKP